MRLGFKQKDEVNQAPGRLSSKELSVEERLKKAEARFKFLEAENEFLKKLEELERQVLKKNRY